MQDPEFPSLPAFLGHISRAQLKKYYGLNNDLFEVLTSPTEPQGDGLVKIADLLGFPVFKKMTGLTVVALIIVSPVIYRNLRENAQIECRAVAGLLTPFKELPIPARNDFPVQTAAGSSAFTANSNVVAVTHVFGIDAISNGSTNSPIV